MHSTSNVRLVNEQRCRVRELNGFHKTHRVPTENNDHTQRFVAKIAHADIGEDLDVRFADFRKHLGLKRIDLNVSAPISGEGKISTPDFEYVVSVRLDDDPADAVWRREIRNFEEAAPLLTPQFAAVFGKLFDAVEMDTDAQIDVEALIDTVEENESSEILIDYDRTATWCDLSIKGVPAVMSVRSEQILLRALQPMTPASLLKSFLNLQSQVMSINPGLPE